MMELSVLEKLAPYHEYVLHGSMFDKDKEALLHRLNGLCDANDAGVDKYQDHEMVFSIRGQTQQTQPVQFRVRRAIDHPDEPWHLRYVGQPDPDPKKKTIVRNCIDVGCTSNVEQFLREMGFTMDFEYVDKGYMFRKGRMRITVAKICRMQVRGSPEHNVPINDSWFVEMSVAAQHGQDQIQDDVKNFAEQLKPLVLMEKLDKLMESAVTAVL